MRSSEVSRKSNGPNPVLEAFLHYRDNFDEEVQDFEGWAVEPCLPFIHQLAPPPREDRPCTIQDWYCAPLHYLRLKNSHGSLVAEKTGENLSPIDVVVDGLLKSRYLARFDLTHLPQLEASEVVMVTDPEMEDMRYCSGPRLVRTTAHRPPFRFKAVQGKHSFQREMAVYSALIWSAPYPKHVRLPKLYGFVTLKQRLLGMLLENIPHKDNMYYLAADATSRERSKWFGQISQSLEYLHNLGCVWGDVKPDNVLIDCNGDAVVIDFGGLLESEWVDREVANTKEGDLQAMERVEQFLKQQATGPLLTAGV